MAHYHYDSDYLIEAFFDGGLEKILAEAEARLRPRAADYDVIAFMGVSGALVAPPLALRLGKPMAVVRKRAEESHSLRDAEGAVPGELGRVLVVDDFVRTGETVRRVQAGLEKQWGLEGGRVVAVYCYMGVNGAKLARQSDDSFPEVWS